MTNVAQLPARGVPTVRLVREGRAFSPSKIKVHTPSDVARQLGDLFAPELVESFYVLTLDAQNQVTACVLITRGILNSSLVHPREVFRAAITAGAAGIILTHNHPSGNPTPSADDRAVTRQLVEAGRVLDVPVYDHVIVGNDRHFSFAEAGLL